MFCLSVVRLVSNTLLIVFKPGVATLNDLKTAVDAAGSPLEAAIIDDTNAPPVVSYDLDAPSLTVRYNPGATALEIVEAINASGPFVAELDLGGEQVLQRRGESPALGGGGVQDGREVFGGVVEFQGGQVGAQPLVDARLGSRHRAGRRLC